MKTKQNKQRPMPGPAKSLPPPEQVKDATTKPSSVVSTTSHQTQKARGATTTMPKISSLIHANTGLTTPVNIPPANGTHTPSPGTFFSAEAILHSIDVDLFEHGGGWQLNGDGNEVYPIRLQYAEDIEIDDNGYMQITTAAPLYITFKMKSIHADRVTDDELKRMLKIECDRLCHKMHSLLQTQRKSAIVEILVNAKEVSITKITRSSTPLGHRSTPSPRIQD